MRVDFMMPSGPNAFLGFEDFSWRSAPHLPSQLFLTVVEILFFFFSVRQVGGDKREQTRELWKRLFPALREEAEILQVRAGQARVYDYVYHFRDMMGTHISM